MEVRVGLVAAAALAAWLAWLWRRLPMYRLASQLPGRRWAIPILGHTYLFFGYAQERIFARLRSVLDGELSQLPYSKIWLGPELVVTISDADCTERVVFNPTLLHKADLLHAADNIVGNGMLFGSGPEVKRRRRGFLPSFKVRMLEQYLQVFHRNSKLLQEVLKEKVVEGKDFHLEKQLHHCSFDSVNETSIGVRTNCLLGSNAGMVQPLIDIYGLLYEELMKPWLYRSRNVLRALGYKFQSDRICDMLDAHIGGALERRKADQSKEIKSVANSKSNGTPSGMVEHQNNSTYRDDNPKGAGMTDSGIQNGGKERAFQNGGASSGEEMERGILSTLEFMLRSDFEISDEDLIMELKNIFMASSDTVAQICSFLFKMFAVHPEYQELAYAEVVAVLGESAEPPTGAQVSRLEYLERCIKETLRLFPIAPFIPRKCEEPFQLDDKTRLPRGTTLLLGVFWLHRSPRHWRRPHAFHPDHFAPAEQAARHRAAFLPFSGGGHSCIGQQYAMLFMKVMAAMVLLEFKVEPSEDDYVACQFDHATVESARNGGFQNGVRDDANLKNVRAMNKTLKSHVDSNGTGSAVNGQTCQRAGCPGRYIPEDYVARMDLSCDISVRLIGGIDVKMRRRNKT